MVIPNDNHARYLEGAVRAHLEHTVAPIEIIVALAQSADVFAGCLDVFGLAALAARRPGVYLDESNPSQTGDDVCFLADRSPSAYLGALKPLRLRQGPAWLREGQNAAPTDGRGEAR